MGFFLLLRVLGDDVNKFYDVTTLYEVYTELPPFGLFVTCVIGCL